jgi:hypothetical protein
MLDSLTLPFGAIGGHLLVPATSSKTQHYEFDFRFAAYFTARLSDRTLR